MSILINLRHIDDQSLNLVGECTPAELGLDSDDEMISLNHPLKYDLEVQSMEHAVLVQGRLQMPLDCECVRCLKRFGHELVIADWACHLPLEGDEKVLVVNDCVDLTPYIREDILLAFPQHPLCDANCGGLKPPQEKLEPGVGEGGGGGDGGNRGAGADGAGSGEASPWSILDKLKL